MNDQRPAFDPDRTQVVLRAGVQCFRRYTLVRELGAGGMGLVWLARDEQLENEVALKFIREDVRHDPEAVRDLKREVRRCHQLTHPNIVRVHDFVEDARAAAIAMEYVPGASLAARKAAKENGCFDAAELAPLVAQLCAALEHAHTEAKIVHRDIKPANLLVTDAGRLKVADFGIARSLAETQTRLTRDLRGTSATLSFASPQQLAGDPPTPADDIYALGATLYDLLTGKPPFFRGDVLRQVETTPPVPLARRRAELENTGAAIPPKWEATIFTCLAKRAESRPANVSEVARCLKFEEEQEWFELVAPPPNHETDPDLTEKVNRPLQSNPADTTVRITFRETAAIEERFVLVFPEPEPVSTDSIAAVVGSADKQIDETAKLVESSGTGKHWLARRKRAVWLGIAGLGFMLAVTVMIRWLRA